MGRGIEHAENDREENPPDKIIDNGRPQNSLTDAGSQQIQIHQYLGDQRDRGDR